MKRRTKFDQPFRYDRDLRCIRRTAGDELDDAEIYSSAKCGRTRNKRGRYGSETYVRVVRDKLNGGFYLELFTSITSVFESNYEKVRFMAGKQRREYKAIKSFQYESCTAYRCDKIAWYVVIIPWKDMRSVDKDLKIRFYGKFRHDAKLYFSNLKPIQAMIEKEKFTELKTPEEREKLQERVAPKLFDV